MYKIITITVESFVACRRQGNLRTEREEKANRDRLAASLAVHGIVSDGRFVTLEASSPEAFTAGNVKDSLILGGNCFALALQTVADWKEKYGSSTLTVHFYPPLTPSQRFTVRQQELSDGLQTAPQADGGRFLAVCELVRLEPGIGRDAVAQRLGLYMPKPAKVTKTIAGEIQRGVPLADGTIGIERLIPNGSAVQRHLEGATLVAAYPAIRQLMIDVFDGASEWTQGDVNLLSQLHNRKPAPGVVETVASEPTPARLRSWKVSQDAADRAAGGVAPTVAVPVEVTAAPAKASLKSQLAAEKDAGAAVALRLAETEKTLETLKVENVKTLDALKAENVALKAENVALKAECDALKMALDDARAALAAAQAKRAGKSAHAK